MKPFSLFRGVHKKALVTKHIYIHKGVAYAKIRTLGRKGHGPSKTF